MVFDHEELLLLLDWFEEYDFADGLQDGADEDDLALKRKIEQALKEVQS